MWGWCLVFLQSGAKQRYPTILALLFFQSWLIYEITWKVLSLFMTPLCFKEFRKYFIKNSALIVWKIAINSCYAGARNRNSPLWILWSIFDHFFRDVCSAKSLAHHINPSFLFSALKCKCCSKCNNGSSPTCNKAKEILSPFSLLFSPIGFYTCESEYGLKINDTQGDTTPPFLDSEKICS